ncbi:MAG: VWA domain-containing protein [Candidatus Dormibacteraeota bacterium]|nr:VWA domain-containing protein [Candidatus Dormibacteraeota bacterium]
MSLLVPAAAVALLALPAIVFLYFLKVRRPEVRVATLLLWRPFLADRQANAPWQRLRTSLLLLLQLLIAGLLAIGLMRPGLLGQAGVAKTTVVMLDASPSMAAQDVSPSRFQVALRRTADLAGQLGPGQQMAVVLAAPHARLLVAPTSDAAVVRSALAQARTAGTAGDFGEALSLADSLLEGRPGGSIVLLSDGHLVPPASPPRTVAPLLYESVGETGENVAVQSLSRSPGGSVFVRLANFGRVARSVRIEMRADGRLVDVLPAHLDGNSTTDLTWNRLPAGTQRLEAALSPDDAFPLDDRAWLVTAAPPRHPVLLVTAGNTFLAQALKLRPGLDVTVVSPDRYRPGNHDLTIFDGFVPAGPLPQPSILVNPPAGKGPLPLGAPVDPGAVQPGNPRDPLLRDVSVSDVHVLSASRVPALGDWRPLLSAAAGPLVLVHDSEPRSVVFTFDLHHSDLPLRAAFPILTLNLLGFVLPSSFENQSFQPSTAVNLQPEPGARSVTVTAPDGRGSTFGPPFAPFTDTAQQGVYTVDQRLASGARQSFFVVQLQDPAVSRIAPGAAPLVQEQPAPGGPLPRGTLEVWPWLAAAALALLALEWLVYLGAFDRLRRRRWA